MIQGPAGQYSSAKSVDGKIVGFPSALSKLKYVVRAVVGGQAEAFTSSRRCLAAPSEWKDIMKTLLVLEDESSVMRLLRHILAAYDLIEATTAEQALRLFAEHDRQVDLLLADVTLPRSSGIQVALLLRSELTGLPVILISGYPLSLWTARDALDRERLGSKSVVILQKPFQVEVLKSAISELIVEGLSQKARTAGRGTGYY